MRCTGVEEVPEVGREVCEQENENRGDEDDNGKHYSLSLCIPLIFHSKAPLKLNDFLHTAGSLPDGTLTEE